MMGAEELVFLRQRVLELEAELKSEKESRADITHSLQKELDKEREAHLDLIAEAGFVSRRCEELAEAVRTIEMEILTSSLRERELEIGNLKRERVMVQEKVLRASLVGSEITDDGKMCPRCLKNKLELEMAAAAALQHMNTELGKMSNRYQPFAHPSISSAATAPIDSPSSVLSPETKSTRFNPLRFFRKDKR